MKAYLDNAATTRLHPEVKEAMAGVRAYGNPSSLHRAGRDARRTIDDARERVADLLGADPKEIIFTSGATEADNIAVFGAARAARAKGAHIVTTAVEHPAVLEPCRWLEREGVRTTVVGCDGTGRVAAEDVIAAFEKDTVLVSVMLANNETGVIQPVREIAGAARERGIIVHCDGGQASGKLRIRPDELGADQLTLSAHKMNGPGGCGVLYVRRGTPLEPLVHGGGQEFGIRPGTENLLGAVAFAATLDIAERDMDRNIAHMEALRSRLRDGIASIPHLRWNGNEEHRLPSILNVSFEHVEGEATVLRLDGENVCVSSGSACASASQEPSHVLRAMKLPEAALRGAIRFSVAADSTAEEVEYALGVVPDVIGKLRKISAVGER